MAWRAQRATQPKSRQFDPPKVGLFLPSGRIGRDRRRGAGDLDAVPWIEAYNAPLRSSAGQFKLVCANRFQGIVSGLAAAGLNHTPMLLAGLPPKDAMLWLIADELRPPPAAVWASSA
jgi:hypothetical protein